MTFPLPLVRFTARRSGDSDLPVLYPRLLRDRAILPKVAIAIDHFQSLVGRQRREFDPEVLVHFFGDHKLARCMVACLARSYRFHPPALEEVVSKRAARRLERLGLASPVALRLRLFDEVNTRGDGFLGSAERDEAMQRLAGELGLQAGELGTLLRLDTPEYAVLTRTGAAPNSEDVVAHYNFAILETLLCHAEQVDLTLLGAERDTADRVQRLCAAYGVSASVRATGRALAVSLAGKQDALGVWARHGRRVARATIELLDRARDQALDGSAVVALRNRRAQLRLNAEALDILGGAPAPAAGWDEEVVWDEQLWPAAVHLLRGERSSSVAESSSRGRSSGQAVRWSARRLPEPQAWAAGVVVPALALQRGSQRTLVCPVRSQRHGARLAGVAQRANTGEPLLFVGPPGALAPLESAGARTVAVTAAEPAQVAAALRQAFAAAGA